MGLVPWDIAMVHGPSRCLILSTSQTWTESVPLLEHYEGFPYPNFGVHGLWSMPISNYIVDDKDEHLGVHPHLVTDY